MLYNITWRKRDEQCVKYSSHRISKYSTRRDTLVGSSYGTWYFLVSRIGISDTFIVHNRKRSYYDKSNDEYLKEKRMNNEITNEQLQEAMAWVDAKYKGDIPDNLYVHVLADKLGVRPSAVRDMLADMEDEDA